MNHQIKHVFISHVHEDDHAINNTKNLLQRNNYDIKDASVHSEKPNNANNPEYIKYNILAPRIQWSGALVVYISQHTKSSDWVNWEVRYAAKLGKRIVGVRGPGSGDEDLPDGLYEYADAIVGWYAHRIIQAINGQINNWETPTGERSAEWNIARVRCQ